MAQRAIPALVKHMTVAIYKREKDLTGKNASQRFLSAFKIARSQLVKFGYLVAGSEEGPSEKIKLTGAGSRKNIKHVKEGRSKTAYFDRMYPRIQMAVDEQDPQAKVSPEGSKPGQNREAATEAQEEEGLKVEAFGSKGRQNK